MNNIIFHKAKEWEYYDCIMLPGWYFWDEIWTKCFGPFNTREECNEMALKYVLFLNKKENISEQKECRF